jgi:hypothetical protein
MEAESSFQNIVVLLFYNLDDGQSPKEHFTYYNASLSDTFRLYPSCPGCVIFAMPSLMMCGSGSYKYYF